MTALEDRRSSAETSDTATSSGLYTYDLAPTKREGRRWGAYNVFTLWANDVHSLGNYAFAIGLFALGLNVWGHPRRLRARLGPALPPAHAVRVHGPQDRRSVPGHEPDRVRHQGGEDSRGRPRCRGDRLVWYPDLSGLRRAERPAGGDVPEPGATGHQLPAGAVHSGLDHLPGPVGPPGAHRQLRHADDPPLHGLRRAHHPDHHVRPRGVDVRPRGRLDLRVRRRSAHRRRDVAPGAPGRRPVGGDLRDVRAELLRLHPVRAQPRLDRPRQRDRHPGQHALLRRDRGGAQRRPVQPRRARHHQSDGHRAGPSPTCSCWPSPRSA